MFYILNEDGSATQLNGPTAADEYVKWVESEAGKRLRIVGRDEVRTPDGATVYLVSTVFLGLDHGIGYPLLFETMVFDQSPTSDRPWTDLDAQRYSTRDVALAGHAAMLAKWRAKAEPATDLIGSPIVSPPVIPYSES